MWEDFYWEKTGTDMIKFIPYIVIWQKGLIDQR